MWFVHGSNLAPELTIYTLNPLQKEMRKHQRVLREALSRRMELKSSPIAGQGQRSCRTAGEMRLLGLRAALPALGCLQRHFGEKSSKFSSFPNSFCPVLGLADPSSLGEGCATLFMSTGTQPFPSQAFRNRI